MKNRFSPFLAIALAATPVFAQNASELDADEVRISIPQAFSSFQQQNGVDWRLKMNHDTGYAKFVFGGAMEPVFQPQDTQDYFTLGRHYLATTLSMHGIDAATLRESKVNFLPLGQIGSSDKQSIQFDQEVNGVPVKNGGVTVLTDMAGTLLAVDSSSLPNLQGFDTNPTFLANDAIRRARRWFRDETGMPALEVSGARLVIQHGKRGRVDVPVLAWEVETRREEPGFEAEGYRYIVDARSGVLVDREDLIHNFDVSGTVQSMVTPGISPDTAGNTPVAEPMAHMFLTHVGGLTTTDASGNFTIVGQSAPIDVTFTYNGDFTFTNNQAQADYSLVQTLTMATGNMVTMNPAPTELVTAEANSFKWVNALRDSIRAVNPGDATADFAATSNVDINTNCNAFWNGASVNFYTSGGGCSNTSFSSVVAHEMGHWLNSLYGNGNSSDGIGEGGADIFSTYLLDSPIVGVDFFGPGTNVRDANNTTQYWGDGAACPFGTHMCGEPLMGSFWKMRDNLRASLGASAGPMHADMLHSAWRNGFNQQSNTSVIRDQLLTLDDDDANLNNLTPNFFDIENAFMVHGYPAFDFDFVSFSNVTSLPDTVNEAGPYVVNADLVATLNPPLSSATLFYQVDGGGFTGIAMSNTGGTTYQASIPGQVSPARVDWYIEGQDSSSNPEFFPASAPSGANRFIVGVVNTFFSDDFESDLGWTHGQIATQDDWQRGTPNGSCGDPGAAFGGSNVWGNDLAPSGFNGCYTNNVNNWLRSPFIDLSAASGSTISFRRQLSVESGQFDQARIRVNGTEVWVNPLLTDLIDADWTVFELDVSALADGNAAVQFEFSMQSDGGVTFGGWTIDDFEVVTIGPVGTDIITYCTGKTTSQGCVPFVDSAGTGLPSVTDTGTFNIRGNDHADGEAGLLVYSLSKASLNFHGGKLCVKSPIQRTAGKAAKSKSPTLCVGPLTVGRLTNNFNLRIQSGSDPLLTSGQKVFAQWQQRDPGNTIGGFSDNLSNGIRFTIQP